MSKSQPVHVQTTQPADVAMQPVVYAFLDNPVVRKIMQTHPEHGGKVSVIDVVDRSLTAADIAILETLRDAKPELLDLIMIVETGAEKHPAVPESRKTVGQRLNRLIELGYAERPQGPRNGATITSAGLAMIVPKVAAH